MRSLAGDIVDEPLLKSLCLSHLAANTQGIITAESGDLPNLDVIADKIADIVNLF